MVPFQWVIPPFINQQMDTHDNSIYKWLNNKWDSNWLNIKSFDWRTNQIVGICGISRCWLVDWSSPDRKKWFNEHTHCIVVILSHPHFISFYPIKFLVYWWLYHILMFPFVVANPSLISQIRMEMDGNIPMTSWWHPHCWLYTSCLTINTCIFCGGTMNKKEHTGQVSWPYTYIYI